MDLLRVKKCLRVTQIKEYMILLLNFRYILNGNSRRAMRELQSNILLPSIVATFLATIVFVAAVTPVVGTSGSVFGQSDQQQSGDDVVLLSNRYNRDTLSNEIVGEVLNNGTGPLDKYDIHINAYFYDSAGVLVGSEQGFIDAQTLSPGDRSAFNVFITDDAIMNEAATYDISINDKRVLEHAPIDGDDGGSREASEDSESSS
jgi:hypothetical protein